MVSIIILWDHRIICGSSLTLCGAYLYRGISDFKKGCQPRTYIVKDEKGDLFADSHIGVARWGNYISHLLNVHGFNDVRQTEIHTAETLVPEPNAF
jgi:hypothetical protein